MRVLKIYIVVVAIALLGQVAPAGQASAAQDARSAWASIAGNYGFNSTGVTPSSTFEENYNGNDLLADFEAAISATADIMATALPPIDPDDLLDASLMNWPDS